MGSNLMLGFSVCIVELFKDNHILSCKMCIRDSFDIQSYFRGII